MPETYTANFLMAKVKLRLYVKRSMLLLDDSRLQCQTPIMDIYLITKKSRHYEQITYAEHES